MDQSTLNLVTTIGVAVFTFILGMIATAFGARTGRALDARKEHLDELRRHVNSILEHSHLMYQIAYGAPELWTSEEVHELIRGRLVSFAQVLGLADALGSADIFDSVQTFTDSTLELDGQTIDTINTRAGRSRSGITPDATLNEESLNELLRLVDNAAQHLHSCIVSEAMKGIPKLILKRDDLPRV